MFPTATTQSEGSRTTFPFDRRPDYYPDQRQPPMGLRQSLDLPRPLEPRPIHHVQHSTSEAPNTLHRQSSSNGGNGFSSNGFRFPGQTLPGLRDILTPASQGSPHASQTAWSPAPPPPPPPPSHEQRNNETPHQPRPGLHPPLALHPPPIPHQPYSGQHDHRLDLPILETQPVARRAPQSMPVSPYAPYGDNVRDYVDHRHERPRQTSTSSYLTASAPSPYTPLTSEDSAHRNSNGSYDRSGNPPFTPTGPEATKKYLGIKEYPGEGTYHVYEGGFRIPTSVDGETVNPQWGLTKANKPRKRLALACLDCREKKIKCEPGANSCLQCEKAKRPCRRAPNQPNPNEGTPSATMSNAGSPPQDRPVERPLDPTAQRTYNGAPVVPGYGHPNEQESFVKRSAPDAHHSSEAPTKRFCSASPMMVNGNTAMTRQPAQYSPYPGQKPNGVISSQRPFTWDGDPYAIDPDTTMRLLDLYFANINNATYCMFPRQAFLRWVTTSNSKSQNDRMVLYAMLAMGSVFTSHDLAVGQRCADIAKEAENSKLGLFSLSLVQTRMLLGLFSFAKGKEGAAWDYCGLAIRAISAMRYNNEEGCIIPDHSRSQPPPTLPEYGFTNEQITECRRRTFWAGFLMDRFNGFCGGMLCVINPADIYLRLPCPTEMYERGMASDAPFFNNGSIDPNSAILMPTSPVAPVAWLILVGGIWGDAMNFIYRATHHGRDSYREAYERVYADTYKSMQDWLSRLPDHLTYNEANLDRSIQEGYAGTFISFHVLYHFVLMKLNRCMRHPLAPENAPRNIRAAHDHAHKLLGIMCALSSARRDVMNPRPGQPSKFVFSTPFPGYATLSAVDIVGAGGPDSVIGQTLDGMAGGLSCLRELAQFWHSAQDQNLAGERRLLQLKNVLTRPYKASSGCWLGRNWGFEGALEQEFDLEADCVYGVHDKIYFQALEDDAGKPRAPPAGLRMV